MTTGGESDLVMLADNASELFSLFTFQFTNMFIYVHLCQSFMFVVVSLFFLHRRVLTASGNHRRALP